MYDQTFQISGMSCAHCESSIRHEVAQVAGISTVNVSATTGMLTVSSPEPISALNIADAVAAAGYEAHLVPTKL